MSLARVFLTRLASESYQQLLLSEETKSEASRSDAPDYSQDSCSTHAAPSGSSVVSHSQGRSTIVHHGATNIRAEQPTCRRFPVAKERFFLENSQRDIVHIFKN